MKESAVSRRQFLVCGASAVGLACLGLVGCGGAGGSSNASAGSLKDGTYTGQSSVLNANVDGDGYGMITVTVENGKITNAVFQAYLPDGTPKDDSYGKGTSSYSLAQRVVKTGDEYAANLVSAGSVDAVDKQSGATFLYDQFVEATKDALGKAAK